MLLSRVPSCGMAGNAAGIAKANAAKLAKRQARIAALRAQREANEPTTPNDESTTPGESLVDTSLIVGSVEISTLSRSQQVGADSIIAATAQPAAITVQRICSGRLRAPVAVRLQASLSVLQGLGLLGVKPGAGAGDVDTAAGAIMSALERGLRLRERREGAEDAKILSSDTVIEAEKPSKSDG